MYCAIPLHLLLSHLPHAVAFQTGLLRCDAVVKVDKYPLALHHPEQVYAASRALSCHRWMLLPQGCGTVL